MTKRSKKPGPETNAREDALRRWVEAIAEGQTMRGAAVPLTKEYGFTWQQLAGWCSRDPDDWGKALEAAQATKIERMEGVLRRIATTGPGDLGEDPGSAKVRASTAQWLLSKWDRKVYGDAKQVEQKIEVSQAPADDTPEAIAEEALELLTPEQREAIIRRFGGGQ